MKYKENKHDTVKAHIWTTMKGHRKIFINKTNAAAAAEQMIK